MDCQSSVENNTKSVYPNIKDYDRLKKKLKELGCIGKDKIDKVSEELKDNDSNKDTVIEVHKKQLQKFGVLCLTETHDNILMWGYYASNGGICIEYDTDKILISILRGFVAGMDYWLTKFLFEDKDYRVDSSKRKSSGISNDREERKEYYSFAMSKIEEGDIVNYVVERNRYLNDLIEDRGEDAKENILNVFIKRIGCSKVDYVEKQPSEEPKLFFDKDSIKDKYYTKTEDWKHEKEFRITASLGGNTVVDIGKECVKAIYLGYGMERGKINHIKDILVENKMEGVKLYKMVKESGKLVSEEVKV